MERNLTGLDWSGPVTIAAINAAIRGLGSAGQNDIFYAYDTTGGEALAVSRWSLGAWSAPSAWTLGVIPANVGLDAAWDSANNRNLLAVSDGRQITAYSYTPSGGAWALVGSIAPLDSATSLGMGRFYPRLQVFDGLYNLSYVEVDSNTTPAEIPVAATGRWYGRPKPDLTAISGDMVIS